MDLFGREQKKAVMDEVNGKKYIRISFPYDLDTIYQVQTLLGRDYNHMTKEWFAPVIPASIEKLAQWKFLLDDKLKEYLIAERQKMIDIAGTEVKGLKGELFPFQKDGLAFIEYNKGNVLLGHEMGCGKGIMVIAWLQKHPEIRPAIIAVPASLKLNWQREMENWMSDPKIEVINGIKTYKPKNDLIIINYDILYTWIDELKKINPQVLVMDEIHMVKSSRARRTKATKRLARSIDTRIGLTGTLVLNRPDEAYNAIHIIKPDLFPRQRDFQKRYCNLRYNGFGWDASGASHTEELNQILTQTIYLRVLKKDVLTDLPEKLRSFVPIELSNRKEYAEAENDFVSYLQKMKGDEAAFRAKRAEQFAKAELLKQLAVKGKMRGVIEWINNFLENEEKLVLFVTHRSTIDLLMETYKGIAVKLDGTCSIKQKQLALDMFRDDKKIKLFVGMIDTEGKPAGVGLNLTTASCSATIELQWSPGIHSQAEDRLHRITQKSAVTSYYLLAINTIEERIAKIIDRKKKIQDSVHDGKVTENESLLTELMKEFIQPTIKL